MHKIIIFFQKKSIKKKYVYLPYLKFSDPLPETHFIFLFGLTGKKTKKTTTINYDSLLNHTLINSLKNMIYTLCRYVLQVTAKDDLLNNDSLLINSLI